jgi:pyruvate ferredoxin oxidoreductase beta subunit
MEAKRSKGMKYIHILSPCPTGWRYQEKLTPNIGRLAVETNYHPLYEIRNGRDYTITHQSKNLPVDTYLMAQGRFSHLTRRELQAIQREVDRDWDDLTRKAT